MKLTARQRQRLGPKYADIDSFDEPPCACPFDPFYPCEHRLRLGAAIMKEAFRPERPLTDDELYAVLRLDLAVYGSAETVSRREQRAALDAALEAAL